MVTEKQSTRGGKREGAGRKKGIRNKRLRAELIEAAKGGILPKDFLLEVMRDVSQDMPVRIDAAKAVAPYVHAKLVAVHETQGKKKSFAEWAEEQGLTT